VITQPGEKAPKLVEVDADAPAIMVANTPVTMTARPS
jgi:hypothetical protein